MARSAGTAVLFPLTEFPLGPRPTGYAQPPAQDGGEATGRDVVGPPAQRPSEAPVLSSREGTRPLRALELILPLGIGAALRLMIVASFLGVAVTGDENSYLRLGWGWAEFGQYTGIWAPLYPKLLSWAHEVFGNSAADAVRLAQVGLGIWTGVWTSLIAGMFGGRRAGLTAAWIVALYLPMAGFTALLYSETLFLAFFVPGLYQLLRFAREGRIAAPWWRAPLAGLLIGLAALTRESTLLFVPPCTVWIALALRGHATAKRAGPFRITAWTHGGGPLALVPAATFAFAAILTILPWTVRNAHQYDRFVPVATSAGGSSFVGWNAFDVNYDLAGLSPSVLDAPGRLRDKIRGPAPEPWTPSMPSNRADAARANVAQGLEYAISNPVYFIRTRIVEFCDLVSPLSFIVRAQRTTAVQEPLDIPILGRFFSILSVMMVPFLMLLALWGWATARDAVPLRSLGGALVLCTSAVTLVSGLTRYRMPVIPMLIILAAVFLAGQREKPPLGRRAIVSCVAVALMLAWIPSIGPARLALSAIW